MIIKKIGVYMQINSTTKIIGLLGHPVKHSFSPNIHNYLFEKYGGLGLRIKSSILIV